MTSRTPEPSRRTLLSLAASASLAGALGTLPAFTASAAPLRPPAESGAPADDRHVLWWRAPADEHSMIEQGLPVGNGRLGALASNDPGRELLLVTDAAVVSKLAGGAILVAASGATKKQELAGAVRALESIGSRLLGIVVTMLPTKGPDSYGYGNYTFGVTEQLIFPEIDYDAVDTIRGMDITIVTTARTDAEGKALLDAFGFPFRKDR